MTEQVAQPIPAERTIEGGIDFAQVIIDGIEACEDLLDSGFGRDVYKQVKSMQGRLSRGAFFSIEMERALENWYSGCDKWWDKPMRTQ